VMVARVEEAQSLLRRLPLRHREKVAMKEVTLLVAKGAPYENIADKVGALRRGFKAEARKFTKKAESEYLRTHPIESSNVVCFLQRSVWRMALDEPYERYLLSMRGCIAMHLERPCLEQDTCVMICEDCDEMNIISVLVHESFITPYCG
jgi:hypothetical protein